MGAGLPWAWKSLISVDAAHADGFLNSLRRIGDYIRLIVASCKGTLEITVQTEWVIRVTLKK